MPVAGLPAAVEKTLTALLCDNAVSSWKIAGEGDNTVVVLRLKPVDTADTVMADPALNRSSQVQYYRRKPPGQVRRDQERARQQMRKHQAEQQQNSECHVLPPLFDTQIDQQHDTENDEHNTSTQENNTPADVLECQDTVDMLSSANDNVTVLQACDVNSDQEIDTCVAGFNTGVVKDYVSTLSDKGVQRRIRDQKRNKVFRKVVEHEAERGVVVLCESDDFVLEYSGDLNVPHLLYWFVKQDEKNMLEEECVRLAYARRGKRLHATQRSEIRARAERDLEAVHGLMQFYLG